MAITTRGYISVLLVDDHEIVRAGFGQLLRRSQRIKVIKEEASNGEEAITLTKKYNPNVIIMDINMPGIGGLEAMQRIIKVNKEVAIIALTVNESEAFSSRVFKSGAKGFLSKRCAANELIEAVYQTYSGEHYVGRQTRSLREGKQMTSCHFDQLTDREFQVLNYLSQGYTANEIGSALHISYKTVHTHKVKLKVKLEAQSTSELVKIAREYNLHR